MFVKDITLVSCQLPYTSSNKLGKHLKGFKREAHAKTQLALSQIFYMFIINEG